MKNIHISKNGECVNVHTPHGQVVIRIYGGKEFARNETRVNVVGKSEGNHFFQTNYGEPVVSRGTDSVQVIQLRHMSAIQMKEMGEADKPTPLGKLAIDYVSRLGKKEKSNG